MYGYVIRDVKDYTKKMLGEERRPGFYSELEGDPFYFVPVKLTTPQTGAPAMTDDVIERRARELSAKMAPGTPPASVPSPPASSGSILDQGTVGKGIQIRLPGDVVMKFCFCPPGSFMMGSPKSEADRPRDIEDQVQVRINKGFWMAQTEVTQAQWKALMGSNPSKFKGDDLPVEMVSWEDAQSFITKAAAATNLPAGWEWALPTEAQWEYACRAGTETAYSFGGSPAQLSQHANFADKNFTIDSWGDKAQDDGVGDTTAQVARYRANAWGLYDMHGNVWEWCADWKADKLLGGTDPAGPSKGVNRVGRGGSWSDDAAGCRAAYRLSVDPGHRDFRLGFRPALVPSNP
jgi:formylglycine-generating enzyme required for sulfatase activity